MSDELFNANRPKPLGEAVTPAEVFKFAKERGATMLDVKFCDLLGAWQHCTYPIAEVDESIFSEGLGFDGSSIRGWQSIDQSDMLMVCDPNTVDIDPFFEQATVSVIADIVDPITKKNYSKDPRNVATKAEAYLKSTGIADQAFFGPEAEFFIFDNVCYEQTESLSLIHI